MKKINIFSLLIIFLLSLAAVEAATVSHPASNITAGRFIDGYYSIGVAPSSGTRLYLTDSTSRSYGLQSEGGYIGGFFKDTDNTASVSLASGDYGIYQGLGTKNYFLGSVGIGVDSPTSLLHLKGSKGPENVLTTEPAHTDAPLKLGYASDTNWQGIGIDGGSRLWIDNRWGGGAIVFRQSGDVAMTIDANRKVGIGTTSPSTKLTVDENSDNNALISIDSGSALSKISAIDFYDKGSNKWGIGKDSSNNFYIDESGVANRLTIKSGGSVGIGTTSPQNKLDIEGGMAVGATYSGTNTAPSNGLIVEGNVGIGDTSPDGTLKLDVEGDVGATKYCDQNGDDCKTITELGASGLSGSGLTGQITFWSSASSLSGNNNLKWDNTKLTVIGSVSAESVTTTGSVSIGNALTISGLKNCGRLYTDGSGNVFCGEGDSSYDLVYSQHSSKQCTDYTSYSGTVVTEGSNKFCRFSKTACPAGWAQYNKWSTTQSTTCRYIADNEAYVGACRDECTTLSHTWSNTPSETCTYDYKEVVFIGDGYNCLTSVPALICTAASTQIGCY